MTVEELYWKLKDLRMQGKGGLEVILYTYDDDDPNEYRNSLDCLEVSEKELGLVGDGE